MSLDALKTKRLVKFMDIKGLDQDNRSHVLSAYMDVKGLEAQEVADKLHVSRRTIYAYRIGQRRVPDSIFVGLAKVFGVVE